MPSGNTNIMKEFRNFLMILKRTLTVLSVLSRIMNL